MRLHNTGPGVAADVRFRLGAPGAKFTVWSPSVRAMVPGEIHPPKGSDGWVIGPPEGPDGPVSDWFIETEFSDISGARWRLRNDRSRSDRATLQSLRTWPYQLWRLVVRKLSGDGAEHKLSDDVNVSRLRQGPHHLDGRRLGEHVL